MREGVEGTVRVKCMHILKSADTFLQKAVL